MNFFVVFLQDLFSESRNLDDLLFLFEDFSQEFEDGSLCHTIDIEILRKLLEFYLMHILMERKVENSQKILSRNNFINA